MAEAPSIIITGPTRGLGLETVRALVAQQDGLDVVLVGRTGEALESISTDVAQAGSRPIVTPCDFADVNSVRKASRAIAGLVATGAIRPIDSLVANAGLQTVDRLHETAQGFELTFGVNVLAQHLFITQLLGSMDADARVIIVGSGTHRSDRRKGAVELPRWDVPMQLSRPGIDGDASEPPAGQRAYATSKLCVNYLVHELDRRHGDRVVAITYDPGMMPGTGLARDMSMIRRFAWEKVMPHLKLPGASTPKRSGRVLADMALGRRYADARGGYVDIDVLGRPSEESFDVEREAMLWEACEELARSSLP
jgi:NAD(P)-dependent dehydrogenase (short-subunit alcohol dehydrogenase family)